MKFRLIVLEGEGEIPREVLGLGQAAPVVETAAVKRLVAPAEAGAHPTIAHAPARGGSKKARVHNAVGGKPTEASRIRGILAQGPGTTALIHDALKAAGRPQTGSQIGVMLRAMQRRGQLRCGDDGLWRLA
jgi:hypothetical protein